MEGEASCHGVAYRCVLIPNTKANGSKKHLLGTSFTSFYICHLSNKPELQCSFPAEELADGENPRDLQEQEFLATRAIK